MSFSFVALLSRGWGRGVHIGVCTLRDHITQKFQDNVDSVEKVQFALRGKIEGKKLPGMTQG